MKALTFVLLILTSLAFSSCRSTDPEPPELVCVRSIEVADFQTREVQEVCLEWEWQ
jgi:hypothetical protein